MDAEIRNWAIANEVIMLAWAGVLIFYVVTRQKLILLLVPVLLAATLYFSGPIYAQDVYFLYLAQIGLNVFCLNRYRRTRSTFLLALAAPLTLNIVLHFKDILGNDLDLLQNAFWPMLGHLGFFLVISLLIFGSMIKLGNQKP